MPKFSGGRWVTSDVVEGIGKLFKGVVKVIKKIAKPILIAAAVYFTAGLALSAFPATAGFAASMPGFAGGGLLGTGIGGTAGTGIFSQAAAAIGLGGGLQAGAAGAGTATIGGTSVAVANVGGSTATGGMVNLAGGAAGINGAALTGGAAGGGALVTGGAAAAGMSLGEKLLLASMGTQAVGAFLAPTTDEVYEAQRKWRGAFYGVERDGTPTAESEPAPRSIMEPATPRDQTMTPPKPPAGPPAPKMPSLASEPAEPMPTAKPTGGRRLMGDTTEPVENDPITLRKPNAKGVRYV